MKSKFKPTTIAIVVLSIALAVSLTVLFSQSDKLKQAIIDNKKIADTNTSLIAENTLLTKNNDLQKSTIDSQASELAKQSTLISQLNSQVANIHNASNTVIASGSDLKKQFDAGK